MKVITLSLSLGPVPGAQRPAQRGVHTAQHTLQLPGNPQPSIFQRLPSDATYSAVVSKAYVKKCREGRGIEIWSPVFYSAAPKCVCVKCLAGASHLSPTVLGTLLSLVPRWTLYRYVPRLCVFLCWCVLAGDIILTLLCLRCC